MASQGVMHGAPRSPIAAVGVASVVSRNNSSPKVFHELIAGRMATEKPPPDDQAAKALPSLINHGLNKYAKRFSNAHMFTLRDPAMFEETHGRTACRSRRHCLGFSAAIKTGASVYFHRASRSTHIMARQYNTTSARFMCDELKNSLGQKHD